MYTSASITVAVSGVHFFKNLDKFTKNNRSVSSLIAMFAFGLSVMYTFDGINNMKMYEFDLSKIDMKTNDSQNE